MNVILKVHLTSTRHVLDRWSWSGQPICHDAPTTSYVWLALPIWTLVWNNQRPTLCCGPSWHVYWKWCTEMNVRVSHRDVQHWIDLRIIKINIMIKTYMQYNERNSVWRTNIYRVGGRMFRIRGDNGKNDGPVPKSYWTDVAAETHVAPFLRKMDERGCRSVYRGHVVGWLLVLTREQRRAVVDSWRFDNRDYREGPRHTVHDRPS